MSQTIRQIMADMLERKELSALELAEALLLTAREVKDHLAHLKCSHKTSLRMRPPGLVPALRLRLHRPDGTWTPRAAAPAAVTSW